MRSVLALTCGVLLLLPSAPGAQTPAQSRPLSVTVSPFRSILLHDGVHAVLRHDPTQRVTFLKGSPDYTRVTVTSGGELLIEKCTRTCPREYELEMEIVTPAIARLTVAHGGTLQSRGSFPRQAALGVTVDNGGTIDIRSMTVDSVTASVISGGIILAKPVTAMVASVTQGGNITYWGDANVTSSIQHGGVVIRGIASEADKPLPEVSLGVSSGHPVLPVSPTEPLRDRRP